MADARPFHWEYEPPTVVRERFLVTGGAALEGTIRVSGAKNAALKMLAAAKSCEQALDTLGVVGMLFFQSCEGAIDVRLVHG